MERSAWTDERLDDTMNRIDSRFDRVDADIRELRGEIRSLQSVVVRGSLTLTAAMLTGFLGVIATVLTHG